MEASSRASPSAAVTGQALSTAATISRKVERSTAPSAPDAGSFASMMSAPPDRAATASAAFLTLTSNLMQSSGRSCSADSPSIGGRNWFDNQVLDEIEHVSPMAAPVFGDGGG